MSPAARPFPRALETLARVSILAVVALFALKRVESADLPWHLATGERILETGSVPRFDEWATLSLGRPWLDIHWLAQVALALLHRAGGFVLLQCSAAALAVGGFALALRVAGPGAGPAMWLVALPAALAASQRLEPRPDLAALFFPVALVAALPALLGAGTPAARLRAVAFIALVQAVWTNVHGSFVLGPMLAAAWLAGAALGPDRKRACAVLAPALGILVLATLANPRGATVWQLFSPYIDAVAARFSGGARDAPRIAEWLPTLSERAAFYLRGVLGPYLALLALAVAGLVTAGGALHLPRALTLVLMAGLSLTAIRNVAPFAVLALAIVPGLIGPRLPAGRAGRVLAILLPLASALASLVLVVRLATNRYYADRLDLTATGPGLNETVFPEEALGWVEAAGLEGQAFHNYEVGGYWIWRFEGKRRAFLDGRLDLLAPEQMGRYQRAMAEPASFEELAESADVTHLVLKYTAADATFLVAWLERGQTAWRRVHTDGTAAVWIRADAPVPDVEPSLRAEHPWDAAARRALGPLLARQARIPAGALNRAWLAQVGGDLPAAVRFYEEALRVNEALPLAHLNLARALDAMGERERALRHLAWLEEHRAGDEAVVQLREELGVSTSH